MERDRFKKFPVKIETTEQGQAVTMLFKDVKLSKPEANLFDPPSDLKKYDSMMSLMQQEMVKRMGAAWACHRTESRSRLLHEIAFRLSKDSSEQFVGDFRRIWISVEH